MDRITRKFIGAGKTYGLTAFSHVETLTEDDRNAPFIEFTIGIGAEHFTRRVYIVINGFNGVNTKIGSMNVSITGVGSVTPTEIAVNETANLYPYYIFGFDAPTGSEANLTFNWDPTSVETGNISYLSISSYRVEFPRTPIASAVNDLRIFNRIPSPDFRTYVLTTAARGMSYIGYASSWGTFPGSPEYSANLVDEQYGAGFRRTYAAHQVDTVGGDVTYQAKYENTTTITQRILAVAFKP